MTVNQHSGDSGQRLGATLREDLRRGDITETIRRDYRQLKEFYLSDDRKRQLAGMGPVRRTFRLAWWLLRSLFINLTPARRILVVLGSVLVLITANFMGFHDPKGGGISIKTHLVGWLCLLFVLMLELKDKLLARNELEAGRKVQEALQPERTPAVPGWSVWLYTAPANDVGGDVIDFMKVSDNRIMAVIGDVAGKGLRAALLMAKLQATIRALVPDGTSLEEMMAKLNEIFSRDTVSGIFASLLYAELVPSEGTIKYVNAGHLPPLLVRGGAIEEMSKGDPGLGLMRGAHFAEQVVSLNPGDIFVAFSDGVTDTRDLTGEFFGSNRLTATLVRTEAMTAEAIGMRLLAAITAFRGEASVHDDVSIVILKRL